MFNIDGYVCYRRDRAKRRGGGVAVYIKSNVHSEIFSPTWDDDKYELIWIKSFINDKDCYIGSLYNPPTHPSYSDTELLSYIERTLDYFVAQSVLKGTECYVILGGDCNQLSNSELQSMGLQAAVSTPTHCGHYLDRLYTSWPCYTNVKVVHSIIITQHKAIVARADNTFIVDGNKKSTTVETRRRTPPQHAALLSFLQQYNWQAVCLIDNVQAATDTFYQIILNLLDRLYPVSKNNFSLFRFLTFYIHATYRRCGQSIIISPYQSLISNSSTTQKHYCNLNILLANSQFDMNINRFSYL